MLITPNITHVFLVPSVSLCFLDNYENPIINHGKNTAHTLTKLFFFSKTEDKSISTVILGLLFPGKRKFTISFKMIKKKIFFSKTWYDSHILRCLPMVSWDANTCRRDSGCEKNVPSANYPTSPFSVCVYNPSQ